jgi:geranylgeranyl pyrophosphate synthase
LGIFYSRALTRLVASTIVSQVIDNFLKFEKNSTRYAELSLLASRLPTAGDPGMDIPGLDRALLAPVREFVSRESKQVRAQLVRIGFSLASDDSRAAQPSADQLIDCLACVVEALHAGSLMIDDIQDDDEIRRGKEALHLQIGVPLAINAANWLYFWPADLLRQQDLAPAMELEIYRLFHKTMMRAHQGQALDLGHDMTRTLQTEALKISVAAIELKTGELMAMCSELGAIVGEAAPARRDQLAKFGRSFGVALQMLNDVGEVSAKNASSNSSRPRVPLQRPSWVWAVAAQELRPDEFLTFQNVMRKPSESSPADAVLVNRVVGKATELALAEFETCMDEMNSIVQNNMHLATLSWLRELAQKVMIAYA